MMQRYFPDGHMSYRSFMIMLSVAIALVVFLSSWSLLISQQVQNNSERSQDALCALVAYFQEEHDLAVKSAAAAVNPEIAQAYRHRIVSTQELVDTLSHLRIDCE